MKSLFEECVILPLNIFKKCNYNSINSGDINKSKIMGEGNINMAQKILNSKNNQEDPMVIRQQELLNERMFGKNTYPTLTSFNSNEPKIKNNAKIPIEEILANIQLSERPYIRNILEKMIDNNILWTSLGEIIIKNQIVPNSNIIDIMRYFSKTIKVNSVKEIPPGSEKLYSLFKSMNIAESWIKVNPNKTKIKEEKLKQQQKEENTVMYYPADSYFMGENSSTPIYDKESISSEENEQDKSLDAFKTPDEANKSKIINEEDFSTPTTSKIKNLTPKTITPSKYTTTEIKNIGDIDKKLNNIHKDMMKLAARNRSKPYSSPKSSYAKSSYGRNLNPSQKAKENQETKEIWDKLPSVRRSKRNNLSKVKRIT